MDEQDSRLLDLMPQYIGSTGPDLRSRSINASYAKFLGKSKEELRGAPIEEFWGKEIIDDVRPYLQRALGGESLSFTKKIRTSDGETRIGKVDLMPAAGGGYFAVISDIGEVERSIEDRNELIHELDHRVNNILQVLHSVIALESQSAGDKTLGILAALKSRLDALSLSYEYLKYPEPKKGWQARSILEKIAATVGPGMSAFSEADPDILINPGDLDAFIFIATELARWATVDEAVVKLEARSRDEGIELAVSNGLDGDLTTRAGAAGLALVESFAASRRAGPLRGGSRLTMIFPRPAESAPPR